MPASGPGPTLPQLAKDSLLRSRRDFYFAPLAADDDLLVTTVDPSGIAVGGTLTLATPASGLLLRRARRLTMTLNDDDAGGGLTVTVLIKGARWGLYQQEYLTVTCADTNDTTGTTVNYYDELTSVEVVAKTADSGDDLTMGIDGTSFGLDYPIDAVEDVQSIINTSSDTEAAATAISSTTVDATYSAIKGITLAATDRWEVRYLTSLKKDGSGTTGVWR
jgi:hypothetical protein